MSRGKPREQDSGERQHREDLLDEALDQSFPASDPPSMVSPHKRPED
jgi:hypothetical protein